MTQDPKIAVGLRCVSFALRAKSGTMDLREAVGLRQLVDELVPGDAAASQAAAQFADRFESDPTSAGDDLFAFVLCWADDLSESQGAEIAAALPALDQVPPDWTTRKDCGHD